MTVILKSIALAVLGTGLFFCFFMLFSAPVLVIMARLNHQDGMYVAPLGMYRTVGLPLAAIAFAACFALAMKRFRKSSSEPSALSRQ